MKPIFREAPLPAGLTEAEERMARLRRVLLEAADGQGGRLADAVPFRRRVAALEIRLLGLRALSVRCQAELVDGKAPGTKAAMLQVRGAELRQAILELLVEAAGYHALAAPNGRLLHNEGPIGPDWAAPAVREMLAGLPELGGGGVPDAYQRLVAALLG